MAHACFVFKIIELYCNAIEDFISKKSKFWRNSSVLLVMPALDCCQEPVLVMPALDCCQEPVLVMPALDCCQEPAHEP
jgi:hypothetical protein